MFEMKLPYGNWSRLISSHFNSCVFAGRNKIWWETLTPAALGSPEEWNTQNEHFSTLKIGYILIVVRNLSGMINYTILKLPFNMAFRDYFLHDKASTPIFVEGSKTPADLFGISDSVTSIAPAWRINSINSMNQVRIGGYVKRKDTQILIDNGNTEASSYTIGIGVDVISQKNQPIFERISCGGIEYKDGNFFGDGSFEFGVYGTESI
jgi:hypothetical protein